MAFSVSSSSFEEGATLAMDHILSADYGFGCGGGNRSPQLSWSDAPEGTKSFAITCFDPDAPTGSGFWHWVVVNIPASTTQLALDAGNPKSGLLPPGALMTRTDFGAPGYGGPCPPPGKPHRYFFKLYALSAPLGLKAKATKAEVETAMKGKVLASAELIGLYGR